MTDCEICGFEGALGVQPARSVADPREEVAACRFCRSLPQGPSSRASSAQLAIAMNVLYQALRTA